ncbi:Dolichyl pyrophosphate Man9GlcNAc2 alpha-1,3-glucosyltransferase [Smittium mucronatum]|uniref:Alpha-1,3-glucosyltransferase n=1 Tax=Smittium mucronatum TaxID=133383 RepID=A0A1R0H9K7_9FUNG|nr:Dolichyl pyrophosphate Man9GlcNAc2 alpha-1,3-glucosyltransferase [Smittium mucronatum]
MGKNTVKPRTPKSQKAGISLPSTRKQPVHAHDAPNPNLDLARSLLQVSSSVENSNSYQWFHFLSTLNADKYALGLSVLFAVFLRWIVGLGPYSGMSVAPMFGDYEAQRHWMELTTHLPTSQWYFYSLEYWGLDYPPLTAYHSWICGYVANLINPIWMALDASRGIETYGSKMFMRSSVVIFDVLIYMTAVMLFFYEYMKKSKFSILIFALCKDWDSCGVNVCYFASSMVTFSRTAVPSFSSSFPDGAWTF